LKKTAALMLLYTYELILIDGTKCKDVSAPSYRTDQILTTFPNIVKAFAAFSDVEINDILKIAIQFEHITAPRRADDDFLCRDGLAEMQASLSKYGEQATTVVPTPPGHIGITQEIRKDPDYKPEFVSKDIWEPKQVERRASMPDTLAKLVSAIRKKQ
jgi:hypothetical protein